MKTIVIFFILLLTATSVFGQHVNLKAVKVTAPVFNPEFITSLNEYFNRGIEYPEESKLKGFQGTEIIRFTVTPEGNVNQFKVINSVSDEIDNEVIRVLETTNGKWKPGTVAGENVAMEKEVSVAFMISPKSDFIELAKDCMKKANELLFVKNRPKKAMKYLNEGIRLLPYNQTLLASRSLCSYELGDFTAAEKDWNRINQINSENEDQAFLELDNDYKTLSGYDKMLVEIAK